MRTTWSPESHAWDLVYLIGLSGPTIVSMVLTFMLGGPGELWQLLRRVLVINSSWHWLVVALVLPPVLILAAVLLSDWLQMLPIHLPLPAPHLLCLYFAVMLVRSGPASEELGWRGFMLPRLLNRFSPLIASLLLAPAWTLWHLPLWFMPLLPHKYWPFSWFVLIVFPTTFLFTWLYLRTKGSLLIVILFHTAINASLYSLPILPPRYPGFVPFGFWIIITWVVTSVLVFRSWEEWVAGKPQAAGEHPLIVRPSQNPLRSPAQ